MKQGMHPNSLKNLKPQRAGEPSINPSGLKKGKKNIKTILRKFLETEVDNPESIEKLKEEFPDLCTDGTRSTVFDIVTMSLIKNAMIGDIKSIKEVFDRLEGTPKQTIEQVKPDPTDGMTEEQLKEYAAALNATIQKYGDAD